MHACMLEKEPRAPCLSPMSSIWRRIYHGGTCFLPCTWHHGSKLFFSEKGLQIERERQLNRRQRLLIHPYSPFKFYWDVYIMIVYTTSLMYMPMQVFYPCSNPHDPIILFCDAMGLLYILIRFCTGTVDEDAKNVSLERRNIVKTYLKDTFFVDVISALPLQAMLRIQFTDGCRFPIHTLLYLLKLFRLIACFRVWESLAQQFGITYLWSTITMLLMRSIFFFHWMTFCNYQIPAFCSHFYDHNGKFLLWMRTVKLVGKNYEDVWVLDKYISNLYLVVGLSIGGGFSDVTEMKNQLPVEQLHTAIISLIGLVFVTYFVITFLRLVMYENHINYVYYGLLKELQAYLKFKRVPERLKHKIQLYINYCFNGNYFNQQFILDTLNVQIRQEINMFCCKKLVVNVPLFQDMPIALINTIIFSLTRLLYMPGEVVVRHGHPGSSIYMIASGTVAILDGNGKEVIDAQLGHLKDGAHFGEQALLHPGTQRTASIIALEITEIYKLNDRQFRAALQPCPRLKRRLLGSSLDLSPRTPTPRPSDEHTT